MRLRHWRSSQELERSVADADLRGLRLLARNAALFAERLGQDQRAREFLEILLRSVPDDALARLVLGDLNLRLGETELAVRQFALCRQACESNPAIELHRHILDTLNELRR